MHSNHRFADCLPAITASLLLLSSPVWAAPVFATAQSGPNTPSTTTDELAFAADVSSTDLLHGNVGTGGSWGGNGSSPNYLTDGLNGGDYDDIGLTALVGAAWAKDGTVSYREYNLGTGANGLGFDITGIQSIAGWQGAGFQNQKYEVWVSTVGDANFTLLTTVDYQPAAWVSTDAANAKGGATKVNVTDDTGILATGVDAIRFNILDTVSANGGGVVMREIDVFGAATTASDSTPPLISTLAPTNGATGVPVGANLVATFNESIAIGTGNITIKNLDSPSEVLIPVGDGKITVLGAVLTINPSTDLAPGTNYAVRIDATAIEDLAGNPFAGISDDTTWNFTTSAPDMTAPAVVSFSPLDNASGVALSADLVVTFDETLVLGTGDILIKDLDTPAQTVITLPDARVSVSGTTLTIAPSVALAPVTNYAVRIDATVISDLSGNPFAGITDDTTWNFTTAEPSGEEFSTTQFVYADDVSASDLLHGLTPVTTGWNTTNESSPLELNDGIHGAGFNVVPGDRVQGAWTAVGATAEYHLGVGPGGGGYDITSVQSIADWVNVGFGNQAWTLEVRPVGGSYTTLATVDYQPLGETEGGTTKVTLTDPSGLLASGIEYIKVTANQVNAGANAGAFVWRELDVFGVPSNDETAPQIVTLSPADNSTGVSPSSNLVATFDENIALGNGTIAIQDLDTPAETLITLPDARVSVSGAQLIIEPTAGLATSTSYAIRISTTAVTDLSGNPYAGIDDDTTWNFTTGQSDLTAPMIVSLSPADGATAVPLAASLVATFDEDIALGSGTITIQDLDTPSPMVITLPDARVSVSGAVLTIQPDTNLAATTNYSVRIELGAVTDLSDNPFAGIADDTTWNFITASAPLRIMCLGDSITTGYTDNPSWANHPFMFGYRSGLYTRLTNAGYNFLLVGGSTEPWTGISGDPTNGGTYTPTLDLRDFGQDGHRGYGGKAASFLNSNILSWLATDNPDIILLKIGTNSQDQSGLNTLVNTITTTKPDCHLIIAQIMPKYSYQQGIVDYNTYIRNTLVPNYQAQGKKVTLVNHYAPFLTNPADLTSIDQSLFSNGINHPDNDGYDKMALVWFDGIESLGIGPTSFATWISDPVFGIAPGQRGLDQDPDGDGIANGVENFFGTDPGKFSSGLVAETKTANAFTFTHPQNPSPATDLLAVYQWSKDLANFHAGGAADGDGTTVTFTTQQDSPSPGTTTVTANISGTPSDRLFLRVNVSSN